MRLLREFIKSILWVEIAAVTGLLIAGMILTWAEGGNRHGGETFFTYRSPHLAYLPAWFAASLALMAVNGFWLFRLAEIEGMFRAPRGGWGEWGASLPINPLRLFAINLIAIPAALMVFLVMRTNCW